MLSDIEESIRQSAIQDNPNFILLSDKAQELLVKTQLWQLGASFLNLSSDEIDMLIPKRQAAYHKSVHKELFLYIIDRVRDE